MLPTFNASIDFYNIDIKNVITTISGGYLFGQCLDTGDPTYCSQIVRNHVTGALTGATVAGGGYIVQTSQNVAEEIVRGIDFQSTYRYNLPAGWGSLSAVFSGSYLLDWLTTPGPGQHQYNCAGLFGATCNTTVNPRWRHVLRLNYDTPFNLFNKDPPIVAVDYTGGAGSPNTFPTYDLMGREAFVGFTAKF